MAGKRTPVNYNGHSINDGTSYTAIFRAEDSGVGDIFESEAVSAQIAKDFPQYVYGQPQGRVLILRVRLHRTGTNHYTDLQQLKQWMIPAGEVTLTATDQASSPNTLQIRVASLGMESVEGYDKLYDVRLWASKPIWENATATDDTPGNVVNGSPERWTVTNSGTAPVKPLTIITPASYKTSADASASMKEVVFVNRSPLPLQMNGNPYPVDITDGGWDTETLRKAGTLHPQGYDIIVMVNGVPVNRYLSNFGAGIGNGDGSDGVGFMTFETTDASSWHGQRFQVSGCSEQETVSVDEVRVFLKRTGASVAGNMTCEIRTDIAGGLPNTTALATSGTLNAATISTGSFTEYTFTFTPFNLNARTWYHLVITPHATGTAGSHYVTIANSILSLTDETNSNYEGQVASSSHSADGTTFYRGVDMFALGDHDLTDALAVLDFRLHLASSNGKVWVPLLAPAGVILELGQGLTGGMTVLTIANFEGTARLPDKGCLVIDNEAIIYDGKIGTHQLQLVKRGARSTTANDHNTGATVYLCDLDIKLLFGQPSDVLGKPRYEPEGQAPCINGVSSTNTNFIWPGPFLAVDNETRPGSWRTDYDDTVNNAANISLNGSATDDLTNIKFKDIAPAGAYLRRNVVSQDFPTGIKSGGAYVSVSEATIAASLSLQHYLTNGAGEEELAATDRNGDAGTNTITPTSVAYRYRIKCLNEAVVGCETNDAEDLDVESLFGTGAIKVVQVFTLDQETVVTALGGRMRDDGAGTYTLYYQIIGWENQRVNPDSGIYDVADGSLTVYAQSESMAHTAWGASYTTLVKTLTAPVVLAAGTYGFVYYFSAASGSNKQISGGTAVFGRGEVLYGAGADPELWLNGQRAKDLWFRVYGTPVQTDSPAGSGGTATIDDINITLDNTTPGTPHVILGSTVSCYLLDALLENLSAYRDTGETLREAAADTADGASDTLDVSDTAYFRQFPLPFTIRVDNELMNVTAINEATPDTITVRRGAFGSESVAHSDGAAILRVHQRVELYGVLQTSESLSIDWDKGTFNNSDPDLSEQSVPCYVVSLDEDDPFSLQPGANTLQWTEAGVVSTNVRTRFRAPHL